MSAWTQHTTWVKPSWDIPRDDCRQEAPQMPSQGSAASSDCGTGGDGTGPGQMADTHNKANTTQICSKRLKGFLQCRSHRSPMRTTCRRCRRGWTKSSKGRIEPDGVVLTSDSSTIRAPHTAIALWCYREIPSPLHRAEAPSARRGPKAPEKKRHFSAHVPAAFPRSG